MIQTCKQFGNHCNNKQPQTTHYINGHVHVSLTQQPIKTKVSIPMLLNEHRKIIMVNIVISNVVGIALMLGYMYLCDNIGLVLACLRGSTDTAASPSQYMTQSSGVPILSPVLFMHVGNPLFILFR